MPDRREPVWPISRFVVRETCRRSDISPLEKPTAICQLDGSDAFQWVRFEVPFSRLSIERLPMEIDKSGRYMDDEARLARQIFRAFTEPITDMTIARRGRWHYIATFTVYTATRKGFDSYKHRVDHIKTPWSVWVESNR